MDPDMEERDSLLVVGLDQRIEVAENVIRSLGRLIDDMYSSDISWPNEAEADESVSEYESRYGVDLGYPFG